MIRCIIVDDEPIARDLLTLYCNQSSNLTLIKTCKNAPEAYETLCAFEIDLVLLIFYGHYGNRRLSYLLLLIQNML